MHVAMPSKVMQPQVEEALLPVLMYAHPRMSTGLTNSWMAEGLLVGN